MICLKFILIHCFPVNIKLKRNPLLFFLLKNRNVVFVSGACLAVLLVLSIYDEDVLTVEHVLSAITILGAVVACFRYSFSNFKAVSRCKFYNLLILLLLFFKGLNTRWTFSLVAWTFNERSFGSCTLFTISLERTCAHTFC